MKGRGLTIATIVLAALAGTLYWSNHRKPEDSAPKASADAPPKILSLAESDISKVSLRKKNKEELILDKDQAGKWQIVGPKPLHADLSTVSGMLSTLSSLNSDRLIDEKPGNLSPYGLSEPSLEVAITDKNGKVRTLLVGDDTPTGSGVYAKLDGDPRVFSIASYSKSGFDKSANDLRDKRLLIVDSEKISRMELVRKRETIEFGRNKDEWQILKPRPLRADGLQVDELIRKLTDAKMDLAASEMETKKAVSAFAAGSPITTAKLTDESGTQELQVRKSKDDYYGKSSVVEGVYKIPSDLGQALDKPLNNFRNKKLFSFGFNDPNKIEMHDGAKTYYFSRSGDDWWSDGKKLDPSTLFSFLGRVRDLSASKFVDTGFGTVAVDLAVTSNDSKRVERVLVSKMGDSYVAKRENEPALYELESKTVAELQSSAAEIKPLPAPAKK